MKILAICFYRPPQLTAQAIQMGRLLRHLPADVTLVAGRDWRLPDGFDQYPDFDREMHRVEDVPTPTPLLKGRWFNLAMRFVPLYGIAPDAFGRWRGPALRRCLQLCEDPATRPDLIASFGEPMSGHIVGLKLARRTRLPWLAYFSDPWADNPYRVHWPVSLRMSRWWEGQVAREADRLVFSSRLTQDAMMAKYPAQWSDKAGYLPHTFDFTGVPRVEPPAGGPIVLRHIGSLYGLRTPQPLFAALQQVAQRVPDLASRLRVELVGPASPTFRELPQLKALPSGLVAFRDPVAYVQSLQEMRSAHMLLVLDAAADTNIFMPSKLIDYLGSRRPVLAITPPGTCKEVVLQAGGLAADPRDVDGIARMLEQALAAPQALVAAQERPEVQALLADYAAPVVGERFVRECALALASRPGAVAPALQGRG